MPKNETGARMMPISPSSPPVISRRFQMREKTIIPHARVSIAK